MPAPKGRQKRFTRWPQRVEVMKRYMKGAFYELGKKGQLTSAHNLGHVQRVSLYAREYVRLMGGSKKKQVLANLAGLTHDRFRDADDSMAQRAKGIRTHEEGSAEFMRSLFEKRYGKKSVARIHEAMARHGSLPELKDVGKNLVRDAVVFADKFFEANGAYIGFRRAMFMGERADLRKKAVEKGYDLSNPADRQKAAIDFTLSESKKRIAAFSDLSKIPEHLHPFLRYQVAWQERLVEGLEKNNAGIVHLATELYSEGLKANPRDLGEVIKAYKPIAESDAAFKQEALDY